MAHRREGGLTNVQRKPPCCASAELFFSCCESIAALPALANCNGHVANFFLRPHLATPSTLFTATTDREVELVKPLYFPVQDTPSALCTAREVGVVKPLHFPVRDTLAFLLSSTPFFSRMPLASTLLFCASFYTFMRASDVTLEGG